MVAGEVKNLANQTAKATDEIAGQIAAVQRATEDAVAAIHGIGAIIGLGLALAAGRLLETVVFASSQDPLVFVGVCVTMIVLGLISSWAPMWRALKIEPTVALRHE